MVIRRISFVAVILATISTGCVGGPVVYGHIPPTTFEFTTTVEYDGDATGGWQIAQVVVLLGRLAAMFPRAAICQVEVGVPLVNHYGPVPTDLARVASAVAADRAARELMAKREMPTGPACQRFRETMQRLMRPPEGQIPGTKVTRFTRHDLPRRTFPPKRGRGK